MHPFKVVQNLNKLLPYKSSVDVFELGHNVVVVFAVEDF